MLVKKEIDDATAQKIICWGTMLLLLVFLMKFIKHLADRNYNDDRAVANTPVPCPFASPLTVICNNTDEKKTCKRQRRRRHHKCAPEQWLPKRDPCHAQEIEYYEEHRSK